MRNPSPMGAHKRVQRKICFIIRGLTVAHFQKAPEDNVMIVCPIISIFYTTQYSKLKYLKFYNNHNQIMSKIVEMHVLK
jgi:hypothetical protein